MDCYHHYLERFTYQLPDKKSEELKNKVMLINTNHSQKTSSDQLFHKQYVFPRYQSLGSPHHFHYLNHLPFDE